MVEPTDLVAKSLETGRAVNRDGVVNRENVIEIIISLEAAPRAPTASSQTISTLTAENLQHWINQAKKLNYKDKTFKEASGARTTSGNVDTGRNNPSGNSLVVQLPQPVQPRNMDTVSPLRRRRCPNHYL